MSVNRNGCTQIFCWLLGPGLAPPCAGLRSQWDNKWIFWLRNLFHTSALVRSSVVSSVHRTAHSRSWLLILEFLNFFMVETSCLHRKLVRFPQVVSSGIIMYATDSVKPGDCLTVTLHSRFGDGDGSVPSKDIVSVPLSPVPAKG